MQIYDGIFNWDGWGGPLRLGSGRCRLRLFDRSREKSGQGITHLQPYVAIVSDVPGSNISVRSCTGHVATSVARKFTIEPARLLWIEYYPEVTYGRQNEHVIAEHYDMVEFTWHGDKAIKPRWKKLEAPVLDTIQQLVAEA